MTEGLKVEGGKTIRKLEVWEVLEALEEPERDEEKGLVRVKAKAETDEAEGYCTLAGNQGAVYLEPFSPYTECLKQVDLGLQDTLDAVNQTMGYLKQKSEEISGIQGAGSLGEVKAELMKMRVRASKAQTAHSSLKKKVAEAQERHERALEAAKLRRQEAADEAAAAAMIADANAIVESLQAEVDAAASAAEALAKAAAGEREDPLEALVKAERDLEAALASVNKGQERIVKTNMEEIRNSTKGPFVEARRLMFRLKVKLSPLETRCKKQLAGVRAAREKVCAGAEAALAAALRAHVEQAGQAADAVFAELSRGAEEISVEGLREALGSACQAGQLGLALQRCGGLTKLGFLGLLREYYSCVKEIALTTHFEVKKSTTVRKLDVGELVEVTGEKGLDEKTGLERVKCQALLDLAEGWVTIKGNQGTAFLESARKPYFLCREGARGSDAAGPALEEAIESGSAAVRQVQPGEVFEVLEGPRREPPLEVSRIRGKAAKDVKAGWATLQEPGGSPNFERVKLLVCRGSIAITSTFDIAEGAAVRKLEVGETFEQLNEPRLDEKRKLTRVHVKAHSDGRDGWATMKGNQGTVYLAESSSHHTCLRSVPLERELSSGSKVLRQLAEGEIFEVLDGPSVEQKQGALRVRGRALGAEGGVGWFTVGGSMRHWSTRYRCVQATELHDGLDAASANVLRTLDADEELEALCAPVQDEAAGVPRVRLRAQRDSAVGFAAVQGEGGAVLLEPVVGEP